MRCVSWSLTSFQLRPHPFRDRDAPDPEVPAPGRHADVREAQEAGRLRLARAPCLPVRGGSPPELDQPGLARVQFQPELREPLAELGEEPLSVLTLLEPDDEVNGRGESPPLWVPIILSPYATCEYSRIRLVGRSR